MRLPSLAAFCLLALTSPARADEAAPAAVEQAAPPKDYLPIGLFLPQIGIGMVSRGDNDMELGKRAFDGTLRESIGVLVGSPRVRIGGFVEARTASFDTFEFGGGPQAMYSFSDWWAMQVRGGVAKVKDGGYYALAGVQFGTPFLGLTVTGRRYFDDHHVELSVNVDVTSLILLVPFIKDPFADWGHGDH